MNDALGTDVDASGEYGIPAHSDSPTFARIAERLIKSGHPEDALALLRVGNDRYPAYASALLVTAKAHIVMRHYREAADALGRVLDILPWSTAAAQLLAGLSTLESAQPARPRVPDEMMLDPAPHERSAGRWQQRRSRNEDLIPSPVALRGGPQSAPRLAPGPEPDTTRPPRGPFGDLEELAQRLETARIPSFDDQQQSASSALDAEARRIEEVDLRSRPATETLADIYERQGRYEEAREIYLTLCARQPERRDAFITRIAQLQRLIDRGNS